MDLKDVGEDIRFVFLAGNFTTEHATDTNAPPSSWLFADGREHQVIPLCFHYRIVRTRCFSRTSLRIFSGRGGLLVVDCETVI